MDSFEIKLKEAELKLPEGKTVKIRIPSVFEIQDINRKLEAAQASEAITILAKFYEDVGVPADAMKFFSRDDFDKFFLFLLGSTSKKN